MTDDLKPCPFCGGRGEQTTGQYGDGKPWHYIECTTLGCGAIAEPDAWNRRADAAEIERLRQQVEAMQWRPIESAPRDGTHIIGWNQQYGARETWMRKYSPGSQGHAVYGPANAGWAWDEPKRNWATDWRPTLWMPLPAPPEAGR